MTALPNKNPHAPFSFSILGTILITTLTTVSMEKTAHYPQLQLQNPKKELPIIHGTLSISPEIKSAIYPLHTMTWVEQTSLQPLGEPYIAVDIVDNANQQKHPVLVSAKTLYHCNDQSHLTFTTFDSYKQVHVTCHKHPNLPGETFKKQYSHYLKLFYKTPYYSSYPDTQQKLIDAGIITKISRRIMVLYPLDHVIGPLSILILQTQEIYSHGPHGCPNKKALIKLIIDEKIPQNKNRFKSIMNRQVSGSFK